MDFAAFTGTPGECHGVCQMLYRHGWSVTLEGLDLLSPDMERSIEQAASSITFTRSPNGRFSDWHNARAASTPFSSPEARWRSGSAMDPRRFGPGDAVLLKTSRTRAHQPEASVETA